MTNSCLGSTSTKFCGFYFHLSSLAVSYFWNIFRTRLFILSEINFVHLKFSCPKYFPEGQLLATGKKLQTDISSLIYPLPLLSEDLF